MISGRLAEVQGDAVGGLHHEEVREPGPRRQPEDPGEECGRPFLIAAADDGVVQLYAQPLIVPACGPATRDAASSSSIAQARRLQPGKGQVAAEALDQLEPAELAPDPVHRDAGTSASMSRSTVLGNLKLGRELGGAQPAAGLQQA